MKFFNIFALCLCSLLIVAGCASTEVSDRDQVATGKLPRPATIWVHDFAATPQVNDLLIRGYERLPGVYCASQPNTKQLCTNLAGRPANSSG